MKQIIKNIKLMFGGTSLGNNFNKKLVFFLQ